MRRQGEFHTYLLLNACVLGTCLREIATRRAFASDRDLAAMGRVDTQLAADLDDTISLMDVHTEVKSHAVAGTNPFIRIIDWVEAEVGNDWQKDTSAKDMTGVHTNNANDLAATIKAVQFALFAGIGVVGVFALLLRYLPAARAVFAHRTLEEFSDEDGHVLEMPSESNPLSWAARAVEIEDEEAMKVAGLDAVMLTKFLTLCRKVLLIICPLIVCVLVPLHYFFGSRRMKNNTGQIVDMDQFSRFGIGAVTSTWDLYATNPSSVADQEVSNRILCWVHAALVCIVCGVTIHYIHEMHKEFETLRWKWLKALGPPRSTTLLVEGIPDAHRSDQSLYQYFVKLFSEKAVHRAYVIRRTWTLRRLLARADSLEERLRLAREATAAGAGAEDTSPTSFVGSFVGGPRGEGAVQRLTQELEDAKNAVKAERQRIAEAEKNVDTSVASTAGFVTFTSRRWMRLASREQLKANPAKMRMSQAPAVDDVRYDDLASDQAAQIGSQVMEVLMTCGVFVFWVPLTGIIASCTSLEDLKTYRGLHFLSDLPLSIQSILEGVFAQLAVKIVLAILPMVLMMIINLNFLKSGNQAQLKMQSRYFGFLVIFVVLVSALSQTLIHTVKEIIADPTRVTVLLAKLPDSAHFYINYIVMALFTLAMALLRVSPFAKFLIFSKALPDNTAAEVRAMTEPEDQIGDGAGARMAKVSHMMTITLVFCHASPSITLASLVWFVCAGIVYKWLVVYAETKKPDLGGAFYDNAIKHLFYSMMLYCFIMFAVFLNAPWGPGGPALLIAICLYVVWNSYDHYCGVIWEQMPFETIVEDEKIRQAGSSSSLMAEEKDQYVQPECVVPAEEKAEAAGSDGKRSDGSS